MKLPVKYIISLLALAFFSISHSMAQDKIRQIPCFDALLKNQFDSIKNALAYQGFTLVREASMVMGNEEEIPVLVPLTEGSMYHIIFIGDPAANLYEVKMFDYQERPVVFKKQGMENNVIDYPYIAVKSEYHMVKPLQKGKGKKKSFCGYMVLFRKE